MTQSIFLKRSAVPGKEPTISQLGLGELAINTNDGKVFLKKDDGTEAIVEVGAVKSVAGKTGDVSLAVSDVSGLQAALDGKLEQETVTSLTAVGNELRYTNEAGVTQTVDLSLYLDDINLARIVSGTYDAPSQSLIFTRDDGSTFSVDASMFFDDTNLVTSVAGKTGAVSLTASDVSGLATVAKSGSYNDLTDKPTGYTLKPATTTVLGGVKDGPGVTIAADGTLSANVNSVAGRTGDISLSSTDLSDNSTIVKTTDTQTISGNKTFLGNVQFTGGTATKVFESTGLGPARHIFRSPTTTQFDTAGFSIGLYTAQQTEAQYTHIYHYNATTGGTKTGFAIAQANSNNEYVGSIFTYNYGDQTLSLRTSNVARMVINSAGNVGFGTGSPTEKVEVIGNVKATSFIGNATSANALATARTISVTGDASGSASFDGSANVSINLTVEDDSHNHVVANIDGLQTTLDGKVDKVAGKGLSTEDYTTAEKTKLAGIEAGAQVNTVTSVAGRTGAVTLSASDVSGLATVATSGSYNDLTDKPVIDEFSLPVATTTVLGGVKDGAGVTIAADGTLSADVTSVAGRTGAVVLTKSDVGLANVDNTADSAKSVASAATLTTGRTIGMTGDVTWTSASFNGSANVTGTATLANSGVTAGTYPKVTVDAKGRVTAGDSLAAADIPNLDASKITSGTIDAARLPAMSASSVSTANWTFGQDTDGSLVFKYNGVAKARLGTDGTFLAINVDSDPTP